MVWKPTEKPKDYLENLYRPVVKKSRKPFKSGEKTAIPLEVVWQQVGGKQKLVYIFADKSFVECWRCKPLEALEEKNIWSV